MKQYDNKRNCSISFAGQELWLDAAGALYWPAEQTLVVSDLHFEKSGFLASHGSPLPRYDTRDTLQKIEKLIGLYQPSRVICLGDSFHDKHAYNRFHAEDVLLLERLIAQVPQWYWILGNHDATSPDTLRGEAHTNWLHQNILFTHEPETLPHAQIIGHYHPKATIRMGGQHVSGPCFAVSSQLLIMPSLGSYTGGLNVRHQAITAQTGSQADYYLMYRQRLWKI